MTADRRNVRAEARIGGADAQAIDRLLEDATRADGHPPLSDHLLLDLRNGGGDGFTALLAERPGDPSLHAYAQLSAGNSVSVFEVVVAPEHRADTADLVAAEMDAALGVLADRHGGTLVWWVADPTADDRALVDAVGMRVQRRLYEMRRPLPTGASVTIETRSFRPGSDDEAWVAVNNRAFADHPEQGGWTVDTLRTRQAEDWFDAAGFRIHDRDGRMAGFCWTKIHPPAGDAPALGEIYVIAVDPDFHGTGLGSQLTLAGLESLAERGIGTATLFVDADNANAVAMYRRLGFSVHTSKTAYTIDVPAKVGDR